MSCARPGFPQLNRPSERLAAMTSPDLTTPAEPAPVVTWAPEGAAFLVRLACPPANQLGQALLDGLEAAVSAFERSAARSLVIHSGLGGFFAAGADIKL